MLEKLEKLSGESTREYIIRVLRTNIIDLNLKPGRNISEKEIAEELGVSRTPVREAFIKLAQEELLEVYPQRGTSISLIDLDLVEEARFVRCTLEKAVIALASQGMDNQYIMELEENLNRQEYHAGMSNYSKLLHLDNQFHRIIFKAFKKERTYAFIESMNSHFNRVRMLRLAASFHLEKVLSEHHRILEAIREKDGEKAVNIMEEHLSSIIIVQEILKQKYPDYFKR